ncbi:unnamed protein product [Nippostrongylus brasiliensis]|uniref:Uncharacterized protein n=1 Tax=Nippostrongylus brasiliensis TaxID=27835 RepID=A0A0N4XVM8_NIPBR|nr:unnamed protein product [Nippostrongylus brasiliensis]
MSDGHQEKKALRKPFASHQLYDSNIDTELKDVEGKQANSLTPVKNVPMRTIYFNGDRPPPRCRWQLLTSVAEN